MKATDCLSSISAPRGPFLPLAAEENRQHRNGNQAVTRHFGNHGGSDDDSWIIIAHPASQKLQTAHRIPQQRPSINGPVIFRARKSGTRIHSEVKIGVSNSIGLPHGIERREQSL